MQFRSEAFSGATRIALRVGLLLIPVSLAALLVYVASQEQEALHHANMRWLAQMAAQIRERITTQDRAVRDRAKLASAASGGTRPDAAYSVASLNATDASCNAQKWKHLSVVDSAGHLQLRFTHTLARRQVCAWSDLAATVAPVLGRSTFTSVVLAQRDGRVLYRIGPETLQITNVNFLFAPPAGGPGPAAAKGAAEPPPAPEPPTASMHAHRTIGETTYAVFVQPVPLAMNTDSGGEDTQWLLIGLTQKDSLIPAASPNDLLALLPFALLLVAFAWPLHKLWSMQPLEPLRRRDLAGIALCSVGVLTVLTMVWLSETLRRSTTIWADRQLRGLAQAIGENLRTELSSAVLQLRVLDDLAADKPDAFGASVERIYSTRLEPRQVYSWFDYADWIESDGDKKVRWTTRSVTPQVLNVRDRKYFTDIVTGNALTMPAVSSEPFSIEQVLSRTTGEAATMLALRSRTREYEVVSLLLSLVSLTDPVFPRDVGFVVIDGAGKALFHSDRSRTFLENVFDECWQSQSLRAVVSSRVPAVLDVDYGAAAHRFFVTPVPGLEKLPWTLIVFRKVAGTRLSRMQILTDTTALLMLYVVLLLLIAVFVLVAVAAAIRRLPVARPVRALRQAAVLPALAGLGLAFLAWWSFGNVEGGELLLAAVVCAGAFLSLALLTAIGRTAALVALPLIVAGAALVVAGLHLALLMLAVITAVLLVAALVFARISRARTAAWNRAAWPVFLAEFVVVCCLAPAILLARLSFDYEVNLRIRDSQLQLWKAGMTRRQALVRAVDSTPGLAKPDPAGIAPERGRTMREQVMLSLGLIPTPGRARPLYDYSSLGPATVAQQDPPPPVAHSRPGFVETLLAGMELPYEHRMLGYDARSARLEPAGDPPLWTWKQQKGTLSFYANRVAHAATPLPAFGGLLLSTGLTFWSGLFVLPGLACLWFAIVRQRLCQPVAALERPQPRELAEAANWQYVILPAFGNPDAGYGNGARRMDLAVSEFAVEKPEDIPESGLLLDHFEARFADPAVRAARLAQLERALWVGRERPLTILSRIDCVRYLSGADLTDDLEVARWSAVLGYFRRTRIPDAAMHRDQCHAATWDACSWQEKVVLGNVARHGLANPNAAPVLEGLVERGLLNVRRGGRVRFADRRFREFVVKTAMTPQLRKAAAGSGRRLSLYAVGLVLLGFVLFMSQEEITTRLIGFLTTVTGGFEAIRRQITSADSSAGGSKKA